jgi:hypothetical protein
MRRNEWRHGNPLPAPMSQSCSAAQVQVAKDVLVHLFSPNLTYQVSSFLQFLFPLLFFFSL